MCSSMEWERETHKKLMEKDEDELDRWKRAVVHMFRDDEIKGLHPSNAKLPKTLRRLLNIGYASDSSSEGGSSHGSSDGEETESVLENEAIKQGSQVVSKDGRLCFDRILPLLPPVIEASECEKVLIRQTLCFAEMAVTHYNKKNKGAEYELVAPLMSNCHIKGVHFSLIHCNFLAKQKNSCSNDPDPPLELFFAEVVAFSAMQFEDPVLECRILTPRFLGNSPGGATMCDDRLRIFLPEGATCGYCDPFVNGYDSD